MREVVVPEQPGTVKKEEAEVPSENINSYFQSFLESELPEEVKKLVGLLGCSKAHEVCFEYMKAISQEPIVFVERAERACLGAAYECQDEELADDSVNSYALSSFYMGKYKSTQLAFERLFNMYPDSVYTQNVFIQVLNSVIVACGAEGKMESFRKAHLELVVGNLKLAQYYFFMASKSKCIPLKTESLKEYERLNGIINEE